MWRLASSCCRASTAAAATATRQRAAARQRPAAQTRRRLPALHPHPVAKYAKRRARLPMPLQTLAWRATSASLSWGVRGVVLCVYRVSARCSCDGWGLLPIKLQGYDLQDDCVLWRASGRGCIVSSCVPASKGVRRWTWPGALCGRHRAGACQPPCFGCGRRRARGGPRRALFGADRFMITC